jgi:hypothetical protein
MNIQRSFVAWMRRALLTVAAAAVPLAAQADTIRIPLNADASKYYPASDQAGLPDYYKQQPGFPYSMSASIVRFTEASLARDGISNVTVAVDLSSTPPMIILNSSDPQSLLRAQGYATTLPSFLDASHAGLGYQGAQKCLNQADPKCWDPGYKPGNAPWAFYLPLGLPMVNQKAVMLLNYPPSDALCGADYLNNFTMARWNQVLARVGIVDTLLYQTIVDVHPIAAPGSGQSTYIRNTSAYFVDGSGSNYDVNMLNLLLTTKAPSVTAPLQVAGSDALTAWGTITGLGTVKPGQVGVYTPKVGPSVPWVATNHPDVTTYQMCPGDTTKTSSASASTTTAKSKELARTASSSSSGGYSDYDLVADELLDLQSACVLQKIAADPTLNPADAQAACKQVWCTDASNPSCNVKAVCIQARLDYDFKSPGNCQCESAAEQFCATYNNQACPSSTSLTSCADFNKKYCNSGAGKTKGTALPSLKSLTTGTSGYSRCQKVSS